MIPNAPVAVTGMGGLCAAGHDIDGCLSSFFSGRRFCGPPRRFSAAGPPTYPVFEMADDFFDPALFRRPATVRTVQLSLTAARQALADADLNPETLRRRRVGVCIGTNVSGAVSNQTITGATAPPSYLLPSERFLATNPAVAIAREYSLSGPFLTIVTACSAGGDAIGLAALWIQQGLCDIVITGGADELYEITYNGFASLMNTDDEPCRPFDARRKGLNLGEGAAILILESARSLSARAKAPRAKILGYGGTSDAFHLTTPDPNGQGLVMALDEALKVSGVKSQEIACINAHGTGTLENDRIESHLFNARFPGTPFLSTKGYTGHTLGASGALEAAFTIACLEAGRLPASAGFGQPDPELPAAPVDRITSLSGSIGLSQTLAFGGNNAVLVLGLPGATPSC